MERPLALVVEADAGIAAVVRAILAEQGVQTLAASSDPEAVEAIRNHPVKVLFVGSSVAGAAGADFLRRAARLRPALVPVILGGERTSERTTEALREGAFDVLPVPLDPGRLRVVVERALAQSELLEERRRLRDEVRSREGFDRLIGRSEVMERLRERIESLAQSEMRVLFVGEPGTGKKLAARTLHSRSPRHDKPLVLVDCSSSSPRSLQAELFGYERGALPGIDRRGIGAFEAADGGSVLLNEIFDLDIDLQDRVLRAARDGLAVRLGGSAEITLDVRILSATSRDPEKIPGEPLFRDELRRCLSAAVVHLPPLRDRREDLVLLARHFIDSIREINDLPPIQLDPDAVAILERHDWPGNIRELRNAMEHAVILASGGRIRARDLPERVRHGDRESDAGTAEALRFREAKRRVVETFEKAYLEQLLEQHGGNVTAAAQQAGMLRSALQRLLRKYELRSSQFRIARRSKGALERN